jgi:hypothetical protein
MSVGSPMQGIYAFTVHTTEANVPRCELGKDEVSEGTTSHEQEG